MRKFEWIAELVLFIVFVFILNLATTSMATSGSGIVLGQVINLCGFIIILIWTFLRLAKSKKYKLSDCASLFKSKFSISEIFLIVVVFVVGKLSYSLLIEFEFIRNIRIDIFKHYSLNSQIFDEWKTIILALLVLIIIVGVFAEELFFRGYLFNVQYSLYGEYTWIVNGISWSAIHIFSNTNFIALLPMAFLLSFVYQRKRNIRITIGAHLIMNSIAGYNIISGYLL